MDSPVFPVFKKPEKEEEKAKHPHAQIGKMSDGHPEKLNRKMKARKSHAKNPAYGTFHEKDQN